MTTNHTKCNQKQTEVSTFCNLTEKWKRGELEQGWYYVQLIRGEYRIDLYIKDKNEWIDCPDAIIDAVVCAVPSYEEWQDTENRSLLTTEFSNEIDELNEENQHLRKWCEEFNALEVAKENEQLKLIIKRTKASGNYPSKVSQYKARITVLVEENQQLKELLYKCREKLDELDYGCEVWQGELTGFIEEIDEVLK